MIAFIARFAPGLAAGLPAFLNPWVLLALLGALVGSFFYGVHMEHGRYLAFAAQVTAAGEAQNERTRVRIATNKTLQKETDREYKTRAGKLSRDIADLERRVREGAGGSFVSAGQQHDGSRCPDGQVCYASGEFDAALRAFAGDAAQIAGEGEALSLKLDTARNWINKVRK